MLPGAVATVVNIAVVVASSLLPAATTTNRGEEGVTNFEFWDGVTNEGEKS